MDSSEEDEAAMTILCRHSRANKHSIGALAELDFVEARNAKGQVVAACKILWAPDRLRRFAFAEVGKFLRRLSGAVIDQQPRKAHERRQTPGRPDTFAAEIKRWIKTVVTERYEARAAISYLELLDLLLILGCYYGD
jgi:hypothetical protein